MALAVIVMPNKQNLNSFLLAVGCGFRRRTANCNFCRGRIADQRSLFGILTDVKLLELSNADLPVLGQLALRAPGTTSTRMR